MTEFAPIKQNIPPPLGLALSGGGFRAVLFHLGVIRFLYEQKALSNLKMITSVSGGSILAAHLVLEWEKYTGDEKAFQEAAAKIIRFTQDDLRSWISRRALLSVVWVLPYFLNRLRGRSVRLRALQKKYGALYGNATLAALDPCQQRHGESSEASGTPLKQKRPILHILAASFNSGRQYAFSSEGLRRCIHEKDVADDVWRGKNHLLVAQAVAASSAYPIIFPPLCIDAKIIGDQDQEMMRYFLTDGGVLDNRGVQELSSLMALNNLNNGPFWISDAGQNFDALMPGRNWNVFDRSMRAFSMLMERAKGVYPDEPNAIFVSIANTEELDRRKYKHCLSKTVKQVVSLTRTDLDRFSDKEVLALLRHGYEVAWIAWSHQHGEPMPPAKGWQPYGRPVLEIREGDLNESEVAPKMRYKLLDILMDPMDVAWWALLFACMVWICVLVVVVCQILANTGIMD